MTLEVALTFQPRPYQKNLITSLNQGKKRAVWVVHRRGGKDITAFNWCIFQLLVNPGWTAFHILPTYSQAKKVIWDSSTNDSKRVLDYIPHEVIESKNGQEMKIRFVNGSLYQLIGSDNIDSLVGTNPKIIIFSEYAIQSDAAWNYLRPILDVNKGYAIFISTPRGKNHFYDLFNMAKGNSEWFCEKLSITDTGVLNEKDMDQCRSEGMSEELIQQEFYCSFNRGVEGSYYGKIIEAARNDKRIGRVPYDTSLPVHTAWDLGYGDSTAIIFWQEYSGEIRIIDFYENHGEGLSHYAKHLQSKPYLYGSHYLPHDAGSGSLQTGKTLQDVAYELGIKTTILQRESDIMYGIENVRNMLSTAYIDECKCSHLIKCLENYHKRFNEKTKAYSDTPLHDWTSHCFTGDTLVLTRNGTYRIIDLPKNGEVLTLCGWSQYTNPRITRKNAPLVEVKFVDGTMVRCTPDHSFLTENGWRSAESLTPHTEIQSSLTSLHNISMVDFIEYGQMKSISVEEGRDYIEMFGVLPLERFLKDAIFIIKMVITRIISYLTWNASPLPITYPLNQREIQQNLLKKREMQPRTGIDQMKEDCGTSAMQSAQNHGLNGQKKLGIVSSAIRNMKELLEKTAILKNIVIPTAKPLIIESVRHLDCKEDVWCLTVPDQEHFSLSNGAIVHNCADATRYMANARKEYGRGMGMSKDKLNEIKSRAGFYPKNNQNKTPLPNSHNLPFR